MTGRRGRPPANRRPIELLTPAEAGAIIAAARAPRSAAAARDAALFTVLYRGGLRLTCEALALRPRDFDATTGNLTVARGKGGWRRVVRLDAGAVALVERWIARRARIAGVGGGHQPLFCTTGGRHGSRPGMPLDPAQVWRKLRACAARAGVDKRVHPHGLRHSYAVELVIEGKNLEVIRRMLGHRSLASTQEYLRGLMPEEALAAAADRPAWSPRPLPAPAAD